jgi:magnesium transporter
MNKKKRSKKGAPPGTVIFTGEQKLEHPDVHLIRYGESVYKNIHIKNGEPLIVENVGEDCITWYDVRGLHDTDLVEDFGKKYNIHPLILEDIASVQQRSKFEAYDNGFFIVVQAFRFYKETLSFSQEQVSIFVGPNLVLSFQEDAEDLFLGIRTQLELNKTKLLSKKADYLAYMLLDTIVDQYIDFLDETEDEVSKLESSVTMNPHPATKSKIYHLKREILTVKKSVASLREAVAKFSKWEGDSEQAFMGIYLRDLYDHCSQVLERAENMRDSLTELQNLYLSEISFKMNAVIQLLTIISAIFIPLTFIVGLYGMNFKFMPELDQPYGYPAVIGLMSLIATLEIWYFKKKKWL